MKAQFTLAVGQRVCALRKQMRLSQELLAEMAETSKQTISNLETGKREIMASNCSRIAAALGVSVDYLLNGTVVEEDLALLDERAKKLTPAQFALLKGFVDDFVSFFESSK